MKKQKELGMLPVFELHSFLSLVEKAGESSEMYLKRGERLFSLARDRCQRQIRDAPFGDEFDGALSIHLQPEKRDNRECLLKMRQFAGKLIDAWEKEGDETDLLILSLTGDRIHIQRVGKGEVSDRVFPQSGNGVLPLKTTVFDEGKELLCFYSNKLYNGSMGNKVKLCTRDRSSKDYYFTDDLRTVLA